jgi:2-aminoadipate transaminase
MEALQYSASEGYYPLREYIASRYRTKQQLNITAENILITNGSQQALDLIGKLFLNPNDEILVERPTYLGALQCFGMYEPVYKEAYFTEDGLDIKSLKKTLSENQIKLFYSIPNFQNPTGRQYSLQTRLELVKALEHQDLITIEDDPYGEISFTDQTYPSLFSLMPDRTILLGSFSKIIAPGLRLGWMVADKEIIAKATVMKQATDLHTCNFTQQILFEYLKHCNLDNHISTIRNVYRKQRDVMLEAIDNYFPQDVTCNKPEGGMFIWLTLPQRFTARELLRKAMEKGIVFVPGDTFYACKPDEHALRLNFSNVPEEGIRKAIKTLGEVLKT